MPVSEAEQESINKYAHNALAANSSEKLEWGWRKWSEWSDERGSEPMPAEPALLCLWLVHEFETHRYSLSSLRVLKWAVGMQHRRHGYPDPTLDPLVRDAVKGMGRVACPLIQKQAPPVRAHHIQRMLESTPDTYIGVRDMALMLTMRDGLLRASEVIALRWGDVSIRADGYGEMVIRRSKTDQEGQGSVRLLNPLTVEWLTRLEALSPEGRKPVGTVGAHSPEHVFGLTTRQTVGRRCFMLARRADIDNFSSHSLRVGAAQDLAAGGASLTEIMRIGRWKHAGTVLRYVEHLMDEKEGTSSLLEVSAERERTPPG